MHGAKVSWHPEEAAQNKGLNKRRILTECLKEENLADMNGEQEMGIFNTHAKVAELEI